MGQFINSDCNTWKASRPSPHCYFMAAHKSRPSSTTVAATTAIKINTAVTNTVVAACLLLEEKEALGRREAIQIVAIRYIICAEKIKVGSE